MNARQIGHLCMGVAFTALVCLTGYFAATGQVVFAVASFAAALRSIGPVLIDRASTGPLNGRRGDRTA